MDIKAAATARGANDIAVERCGWVHVLGWRLFLVLVALTPLVIGGLPPLVGTLASFRTFDAFDLPKAVTILVLAGLSLAALSVSAIRGEFDLRWHPVLWVMVALFGWAGVSALFSPSPVLSVWGSYNGNEGLVAVFGYGLVAFLAIQYVRSTRDLRTLGARPWSRGRSSPCTRCCSSRVSIRSRGSGI
jgi:hypothetical protein